MGCPFGTGGFGQIRRLSRRALSLEVVPNLEELQKWDSVFQFPSDVINSIRKAALPARSERPLFFSDSAQDPCACRCQPLHRLRKIILAGSLRWNFDGAYSAYTFLELPRLEEYVFMGVNIKDSFFLPRVPAISKGLTKLIFKNVDVSVNALSDLLGRVGSLETFSWERSLRSNHSLIEWRQFSWQTPLQMDGLWILLRKYAKDTDQELTILDRASLGFPDSLKNFHNVKTIHVYASRLLSLWPAAGGRVRMRSLMGFFPRSVENSRVSWSCDAEEISEWPPAERTLQFLGDSPEKILSHFPKLRRSSLLKEVRGSPPKYRIGDVDIILRSDRTAAQGYWLPEILQWLRNKNGLNRQCKLKNW